jgi:hypothetical protein
LDPKPGPKLIGHLATDPLWWPARSAAETVAGQIFSVEYDGIEYGGLPVKYAVFVIMLCFNVFGDLRAAIALFGT